MLPLLALLGCKPPPDAPEELDALVGYLFQHTDDEEDEPLVVGAGNLDAWLTARLEETLEGYAVDQLSEAAVEELGLGEPDLGGLAGAAVGHDGPYGVEELGAAVARADPLEIYVDNYTGYDRTYAGDPDCFAAGDCLWLEADSVATASFALGLEVVSRSHLQYRWVDTESGRIFVQRSWMTAPAEVSVDWLRVDQQFFLWVIIPDQEGSRSIQATWILATITGAEVPESVALNLVVEQMQTFASDLDAYVGG